MSDYTLSSTYKIFYRDIISDLLHHIFARFCDYCVDRDFQYELNKKYEKLKKAADEHMGSPKLDRHKLASCMCGAIIELQPIRLLSNRQLCPKRANELLALYAGLGIIKDFMIYDVLCKIPSYSKERQSIKNYLKDNFKLILPSLDDKICDTQEYAENLYNALLWTHNECVFKSSECYHYDIWAYSTIFYHIESYNKIRLENLVKKYKEQDT